MEQFSGSTATAAGVGGEVSEQSGAAHRLRALVAETEARGAPMVSSQALQRRLFEVYDAASAVPEALGLVQHNLGLTLDRTWYSAVEVGTLADQIDRLLAQDAEAAGAAAEPESAVESSS
jgi:hypothetical protein